MQITGDLNKKQQKKRLDPSMINGMARREAQTHAHAVMPRLECLHFFTGTDSTTSHLIVPFTLSSRPKTCHYRKNAFQQRMENLRRSTDNFWKLSTVMCCNWRTIGRLNNEIQQVFALSAKKLTCFQSSFRHRVKKVFTLEQLASESTFIRKGTPQSYRAEFLLFQMSYKHIYWTIVT